MTEEEVKGLDDKEAGRRQLAYTNSRIRAFVEGLLALPEDQQPIIILQADEGPCPDRVLRGHGQLRLERRPRPRTSRRSSGSSTRGTCPTATETCGLADDRPPSTPSRCCSAATSASTTTELPDTVVLRRAGTGPTSMTDITDSCRVCQGTPPAAPSAQRRREQEERPWALRDRLLADELEPVAGRCAEPVERVVVEDVAARGEEAADHRVLAAARTRRLPTARDRRTARAASAAARCARSRGGGRGPARGRHRRRRARAASGARGPPSPARARVGDVHDERQDVGRPCSPERAVVAARPRPGRCRTRGPACPRRPRSGCSGRCSRRGPRPRARYLAG